ncbi:MAG TPA: hypothetical protein VGK30_03075 [Candidatus Binatia bacterium]|jgi:hypothetical protein
MPDRINYPLWRLWSGFAELTLWARALFGFLVPIAWLLFLVLVGLTALRARSVVPLSIYWRLALSAAFWIAVLGGAMVAVRAWMRRPAN